MFMKVRINAWKAGGIVALVVGAVGGLFRLSGLDSTEQRSGADTWPCSLHPQVRLNHSGRRPICGMAPAPAAQVTAEGAMVSKLEVLTDPRVESSIRHMRLDTVAISHCAATCGADVTAAKDVACEVSGVSPA